MKNLLESEYLLNEPRVVLAYWKLKGISEWQHGSVQVEIREDSDGLYELRACPKCGVMWTWHTKHGERDYPYELCQVPDPIPGSLADVAEAMRVAIMMRSDIMPWSHWLDVVIGFPLCREDLTLATSTEQIVAAVIAWEAK